MKAMMFESRNQMVTVPCDCPAGPCGHKHSKVKSTRWYWYACRVPCWLGRLLGRYFSWLMYVHRDPSKLLPPTDEAIERGLKRLREDR